MLWFDFINTDFLFCQKVSGCCNELYRQLLIVRFYVHPKNSYNTNNKEIMMYHCLQVSFVLPMVPGVANFVVDIDQVKTIYLKKKIPHRPGWSWKHDW